MDYSKKTIGDRFWFQKDLPVGGTAVTARVDLDFKRELDILAESSGVTIGTVAKYLIYAGYEKYGEDMDRYAEAQDDLSERLEALGHDDTMINALFEKYTDLSELNKLVVELEEKKR